jgi:hypothetical protein
MQSSLMIRVHWDVIYDRAPLPFDIFLKGAFEDDDMPRYVGAESDLSLSPRVFPPPTAIDAPRFDPTQAAAAAVLRSSLPFFFFNLRNSPRPSR